MDGTLTLAAHNFDDIRQSLGIEQGLPILEAIDQMTAEKATFTRLKLHEIEMEIAMRSQPQPGAYDTLSLLQANGFKLGILTRNSEDIAQATLDAAGLAGFFSEQDIVGRSKCAPKPEPDGIHKLAALWGAPPAATAMVGDYLFDLQSGRNAGVTTVHFDISGQFTWPQLTDVSIRRFDEICTHL